MKRVLLTVGWCGVALLGCIACGKEQIEIKKSVDTAMGTIVSQSVYVTDVSNQAISPSIISGREASEEQQENMVESATEGVQQVLSDLEQQVLSWRIDTSQVAKINAAAGTLEGSVLSEEMEKILLTCNEISKASNGAFDVSIGSVVRLWDIDSWASGNSTTVDLEEEYVLPSQEKLNRALENTGYEKLLFRESKAGLAQTIIMPAETQIDLGAVGKGIALDYIHEYLQDRPEIVGAVISVGGSVLTYGSKDSNETVSNPWKVGIVNPLNTQKNIGYLMLNGQWCVSTSGDYERYVEVDGKRYHHLIDPSTGMPADSGVRTVTILTKSGLESDALSTACFILGIEEGMKLAEEYEAEVLFVDANGEIIMSEGMEQYFHLY